MPLSFMYVQMHPFLFIWKFKTVSFQCKLLQNVSVSIFIVNSLFYCKRVVFIQPLESSLR